MRQRPRRDTAAVPLTAARLLRIELRRNAMPLILPLIAALFWFDSYRPSAVQPPFWVLRTLLTGTVLLSAPFSSARSRAHRRHPERKLAAHRFRHRNITHRTSQIAGFVTGAAVVGTIGRY